MWGQRVTLISCRAMILTMGKNKAKRSKSKNVFQVASKRNMKAKNKAKPVTSNLKKISIINEEKIKSINKTLAAIQEQLTHLSKGITTEGPQRHLIPKHPKGELTGIEDALRLMALL
ncbi:ribosomal biogenesis factor isoform X2 [Ornithorhynchus anatinus]|nr:ribosomal biogenesis factor isoform X2 [Ornithorhynchus anatinus]